MSQVIEQINQSTPPAVTEQIPQQPQNPPFDPNRPTFSKSKKINNIIWGLIILAMVLIVILFRLRTNIMSFYLDHTLPPDAAVVSPSIQATRIKPQILYAIVRGHQLTSAPGSYVPTEIQTYIADTTLSKIRPVSINFRIEPGFNVHPEFEWKMSPYGKYLITSSKSKIDIAQANSLESPSTIFEDTHHSIASYVVSKDEKEIAIQYEDNGTKFVIISLADHAIKIIIIPPDQSKGYILFGFDNQRHRLFWNRGAGDVLGFQSVEFITYDNNGSILNTRHVGFDFLAVFDPEYNFAYEEDNGNGYEESVMRHYIRNNSAKYLVKSDPSKYYSDILVSPKGDKIFFTSSYTSKVDLHKTISDFNIYDLSTAKNIVIHLPYGLNTESGKYLSPDGNFALFHFGDLFCNNCDIQNNGKEIILDIQKKKFYELYNPKPNLVKSTLENGVYSTTDSFHFISWLGQEGQSAVNLNNLTEYKFPSQ